MSASVSAALAETVQIVIVTEIRDFAIDSFEGVKSRQIIKLDLKRVSATSSYETGDTLGIGSINDSFRVSTPSKTDNNISFKATGQTETAIAAGAAASIDYSFDILINVAANKIWVSGMHNEYPSYTIRVNSKMIYERAETGNPLTGLLDANSVAGVFVDGVSF